MTREGQAGEEKGHNEMTRENAGKDEGKVRLVDAEANAERVRLCHQQIINSLITKHLRADRWQGGVFILYPLPSCTL